MSNDAGKQSICPHCGQAVDAAAHFCANCGQPLIPAADPADPPATIIDVPEQAEWLLTVLTGPDQGKGFPVGQRLLIGRDASCDVILDDPKASRQHAAIERAAQGRYLLVDLDSSNGTFLLGERVERAELPAGAQLRIGDTNLMLTPAGESCARCGQPVSSGHQQCPHCGHNLGEPAEFDLERRIAELEAEARSQPVDQVDSQAAVARAESSGEAGSVFRPPRAAAAEPAPAQSDSGSEREAAGRSSLQRLAGIGCLGLSLLLAAAACCTWLGPLLEDLF